MQVLTEYNFLYFAMSKLYDLSLFLIKDPKPTVEIIALSDSNTRYHKQCSKIIIFM